MRPHLLLLLSINYRRRDEKRAPQKTPAWEARSDQDIFFSLYCNKMLLIRRKENAVDAVANICMI